MRLAMNMARLSEKRHAYGGNLENTWVGR